MQILWMFVALFCSPSALALEIGQETPALEVAGTSTHGKVVLVNFWATWCGPCRAELPLLDALHERISEDGAMVIAVNIDTRSRVAEATLRHLNYGGPMLFDPRGDLASQFAPPAMPTSYLLDQTGKVRKVVVGEVDEQAVLALEDEIRQLMASTE